MSATEVTGLERLLREAERRNEIALHWARGVLWILVGVVAGLVVGRDVLPKAGPFPYLVMGGTTIAWFALFRLVRAKHYIPRLKYLLIFVDTGFFFRAAVAFRLVLPGLGFGELVPLNILGSILPLGYMLAAFSGALRFSTRAAAWSAALAVAAELATAALLDLDVKTWAPQLVLIALTGLLGIVAARVLREIMRKAEQERVLERYVPEGLVTELARAQDLNQMARSEELSVLFADIRGFTQLSEPLTPAQSVSFLNSYFATIVAPIAEHRGVIDKYLGDGVLVFFEGTEHAARAVRTARGMLDAVDRFNAARPSAKPVRIGVAIHTGEVLIGTVGAPTRMEYTVIGDTVNVASRLEALNKEFGSSVVISAASMAAVGASRAEALGGMEAMGPRATEIRGRSGELEVYWASYAGATP